MLVFALTSRLWLIVWSLWLNSDFFHFVYNFVSVNKIFSFFESKFFPKKVTEIIIGEDNQGDFINAFVF